MPPSPPSSRFEITPNGHAVTQYPQPLQTSSWITTVPNSVRVIAPVGQTSRQPACVQCLQTSELISQRNSPSRGRCSTKATWRQVFALSSPVLSYELPVKTRPSSGTRFH